jgi:hypothetical protein
MTHPFIVFLEPPLITLVFVFLGALAGPTYALITRINLSLDPHVVYSLGIVTCIRGLSVLMFSQDVSISHEM